MRDSQYSTLPLELSMIVFVVCSRSSCDTTMWSHPIKSRKWKINKILLSSSHHLRPYLIRRVGLNPSLATPSHQPHLYSIRRGNLAASHQPHLYSIWRGSLAASSTTLFHQPCLYLIRHGSLPLVLLPQSQHLDEAFEFWSRQFLGEDIRYVFICRYVLDLYLSVFNCLTNEMVS